MPERLGTITVTGPDAQPFEYVIKTPIVRVGRMPEPQNDLVLAHNWVSRSHLRIYCDRLPFRVQDLHSSNGSALNDVPLPADEIRDIKSGDVISVGPFRLTVQVAESLLQEEAAPPPLIAMQPRPAAADVPPPIQPIKPPEPALERWVGMDGETSRWLQYLPPMFAEHPFLGRFLCLFEDQLGPLEQTIRHFDVFLDVQSAPATFIPQLNTWLAGIVDESWPEAIKRAILARATWLYERRGTRAGLEELLHLCTGAQVEIIENSDGPFTFRVVLTAESGAIDQRLVTRLIDGYRPAYTSYQIDIKNP
ncbi:MAG: FHA domain-containing protein [Chloroflexi bacterium]|nr:FHA domain-containing protein [Chloroflexota bacterium]